MFAVVPKPWETSVLAISVGQPPMPSPGKPNGSMAGIQPCVKTMVFSPGARVPPDVKLPLTNVLSCEGEGENASAGVVSATVGERVVPGKTSGWETVNWAAALSAEP